MHSLLEVIILNGVPTDLVYFLLLVPFVVMIGTFARHVVGLKVLGMSVLVSMVYIVSFLLREYSMLSVGIGAGLIFFIYAFSYFIKRLTVTLGLHYFARISIVITMISIVLLSALVIAGRYVNIVESLKLNEAAPFVVVIAVLLSEQFSSNQTQKGIKKSRQLFITSLVISVLVGLLVSWDRFEIAVFNEWYLVFVCMILTFLSGRYKGMRLTEVLRFRDIKLDAYRE